LVDVSPHGHGRELWADEGAEGGGGVALVDEVEGLGGGGQAWGGGELSRG
jgi:hypothetical protein